MQFGYIWILSALHPALKGSEGHERTNCEGTGFLPEMALVQMIGTPHQKKLIYLL